MKQDLGNNIYGEIQVHTPKSWEIKLKTDVYYDKWRDVNTKTAPANLVKKYEADQVASQKLRDDYFDSFDEDMMAPASSSLKGLDSKNTPKVPSNRTQEPPLKTSGGLPSDTGAVSKTFPAGESINLPGIESPTSNDIISHMGPTRERGMAKTAREADTTHDALRDSLNDTKDAYKQLPNETTEASALRRISVGYDEALKDWEATKNELRADNVPFAYKLANEAINRGDVAKSREILGHATEMATRAGQYGQAVRIIKDSNDPIVVAQWLRTQLDKINTEGRQLTKKWKDIEPNEDVIQQLNAFGRVSNEAKDEVFKNIQEQINNQIPVTLSEKFNSWRPIAMLLNPTGMF